MAAIRCIVLSSQGTNKAQRDALRVLTEVVQAQTDWDIAHGPKSKSGEFTVCLGAIGSGRMSEPFVRCASLAIGTAKRSGGHQILTVAMSPPGAPPEDFEEFTASLSTSYIQDFVALVERTRSEATFIKRLSFALEDAEREISRLLDLLEYLRRQTSVLSRKLGEVEAERNQLKAILEAMQHQHGCRSEQSTTVKWLGRAAAAVMLAIITGVTGGIAQGLATAPTVVNIPPADTGDSELDAQLVETLDKCVTLIQVADETLPDSL